MFWPRWHKPVNDHEDFRHHLACFLPKYGDVQLNMIKRENGEQPTPNRFRRCRISPECREQIKTAYASGIGLRQIARNTISRQSFAMTGRNHGGIPAQRFSGPLSHSVFHGRFLRSEDFLLQNRATLRHATRKLNR